MGPFRVPKWDHFGSPNESISGLPKRPENDHLEEWANSHDNMGDSSRKWRVWSIRFHSPISLTLPLSSFGWLRNNSSSHRCSASFRKDSQMIKNRPFLIRGAPDAPPGAPKASWTAYTAADCTLPPGTLGYSLSGSAPAPGPGETTFTDYFLPLSLYLLPSTMWFLVDPHATSLVPRGRRIRKGCALCRRPRKKNKVAFEFELYSSEY